MEEPHHEYLMWMKRKQILNSSSWEEKAFAEDAARILGGCNYFWPPRSYSCNFCKRNFRSAQALGGHMNVHRRDRARLKQISHNNELSLHDHHQKNDCKSSFGVQFSSDSCPNPFSNLTPSKSLSSSHEILCQKTLSPYSSSSSEPKGQVNRNNDYVETSLAVGKSSVCGQNLQSDESCEDKGICYKKPKTNSASSLPGGFLKPCSNDRLLTLQSAEFVLGVKPGMEDLDLELRLGKPQKVI